MIVVIDNALSKTEFSDFNELFSEAADVLTEARLLDKLFRSLNQKIIFNQNKADRTDNKVLKKIYLARAKAYQATLGKLRRIYRIRVALDKKIDSLQKEIKQLRQKLKQTKDPKARTALKEKISRLSAQVKSLMSKRSQLTKAVRNEMANLRTRLSKTRIRGKYAAAGAVAAAAAGAGYTYYRKKQEK